ncbi:MAG: hypothetical protein INR68_05775 [Methylobacterium mesophilicum]|nr:hypothetical protein [Methylobacterium mesophilicum]
MSENRRNLTGAALFLAVFALSAYFLPTIMLELGGHSQIAAICFAALFLVAPFVALWLRSRAQAKRDSR